MSGEFTRKDFLEAIEKSHESYRNSGFALMTTIIGLSSGVWYAFNGTPRFVSASSWFLRAFLTALAHETVFYGASLLRARHTVLNWEAQSKGSNDPIHQKAQNRKKWSDRFFNLSDGLCFVAVLLFIIGVFQLW